MNILSSLTSIDIFLIWLSLVLLVLFLYTFKAFKESEKKNKNTQNLEEKRWHELEEKAQKDYQQILETANKKAAEIISQATKIKNETEVNFNNSITTMLENQKKQMESSSSTLSRNHLQEMNRLNDQSIQILTNVYKDIELAARTDLEKYRELINAQTFEAEKIAQQRIKEEYIKLEKEIQERKTQRLHELDENIYRILSLISKDIIGKSLSFSDHEELVLKALDDAKKEGAI